MKTFMKWDKVLIVDIEATCDEPEPEGFVHEIIEIGVALVNVKTLTIERTASILVEPLGVITPFCTQLTTLTLEQIREAKAPRFREGCAALEDEFLSRSYPWISWGDYDRRQFKSQCEREGVRYPFSDTHTNMRALFSWWQGKGRRVGMAEALKWLNLPLEGTHHRGVDDAKNIARIFIEFLRASRNRHTCSTCDY